MKPWPGRRNASTLSLRALCVLRAWPLLLLVSLLSSTALAQDKQGASGATVHRSLMLSSAAAETDFSEGSLVFIGNATVLLEFAGFRILTDPNFLHRGELAHLGYGLTTERLTNPAMSLDQLPPVDLVVLSHLHGDHFDQLVQQKLDRDLPIVTTPDAAAQLGRMGFKRLFSLGTWETLTVRKGDATLRITGMPARHGPPVLAAALPETMGSMLDFVNPGGAVTYRIYITGDTLVFDAIKDIPRRYPDVDLALLHLGGTRVLGVTVTMDAAEGVKMMRLVAPRHAVPIHYNDYDVFKSPLSDFERMVREAGLAERLTFLKHGQRYRFVQRPEQR
ncbi:MAG: fold metallo-hydrolase [Paucimonas sp.]|nr:fold metallo-hydrolase [Paucimonas sp.]